MRLPFQVYSELDGNLQAMDGVVIEVRAGAIFATSADGEFSHDAPGPDYAEQTRASGASGAVLTGGSGRNLVASGGPVSLNGFFRPEITDEFRNGAFLLVKTGPSAATISDGTDVVAALTTGGTAPVGSYVATTYGEDTYNAGLAFTLILAAEEGGPGTIPNATVAISAGSAQFGEFTAVDASNFVSVVDPDWTIALQSGGEGWLKYLTETVAIRAVGTAFDPSGRYDAVEAAYIYNPVEPESDELDDRPETNPFGVLTMVYSWPATPDLDSRTAFLDGVVGYGYSSSADYMTFSGDDQDPAGSETVVIDLATAWDDELISDYADIACCADWYPPRGGHGPATLDITYDLGAGPVSLYSGPIYPGSEITPATTRVKTIRILADGTMEAEGGPWSADVRRVAVAPRAGYVYLKLTETAGALTAVEGPFLATDLPTCTASVFYFPIATSDGVGGIRQLHTGALAWQCSPQMAMNADDEFEITIGGVDFYVPFFRR